MRTLAASVPLVLASVAWAQAPIVFVHDQVTDEIYRLADLNNDGDANDPGEATLFVNDDDIILGIDNAQGLVALAPGTLLATDNFEPDNIVLFTDTNDDGNALGPSEAAVWFSGALPGGFTLTNPAELLALDDGAYLLLDNNTLDTANPEAIYRLEDLNADNDVDDPGEVTPFFELSPPGISAATTQSLARNAAGEVFVLDISDPNQIESVDIINADATTRTEWFSSTDLFNLTGAVLQSTVAEVVHLPTTDEIAFGAVTLGGDLVIVAARDTNASGRIDSPAELRPIWIESQSGFDTGSPRDFDLAHDGSLFWTDAARDRVMRLVDLNADTDFRDPGETTVFFDQSGAFNNALPQLGLPLSVASTPAGPAPCTPADLAAPFGLLDLTDVDAFIAAFQSGDPAASPSADIAPPFGFLDLSDLDTFIGAFLAGCP